MNPAAESTRQARQEPGQAEGNRPACSASQAATGPQSPSRRAWRHPATRRSNEASPTLSPGSRLCLGRQSTMTRRERIELLKGTLDLLILRTLLLGPAHGHQIAKHIQRTSDEVLQVEHGSLYPALHRLEGKGWLVSKWETGSGSREFKFYRLERRRPETTRRRRIEVAAARGGHRPRHRAIGGLTYGFPQTRRRRAGRARRPIGSTDLDREIQSHLDLEAEDAGPPAARRAFGNTALVKEDVRAEWGWPRLEQFVRDVRFGFRQIRRNLRFSTMAIATLALGIGGMAAMFSAFDTILIRPLPYTAADQLVMIWDDLSRDGIPKHFPSSAEMLEWRRRNTVFSDIAATQPADATLSGDGAPDQVRARKATANLWSVLGVSPRSVACSPPKKTTRAFASSSSATACGSAASAGRRMSWAARSP